MVEFSTLSTTTIKMASTDDAIHPWLIQRLTNTTMVIV
jgi:hypothetical protein